MAKEDKVFITARQLRFRYGDVSHMWLERRMAADPRFPKPVYFGMRRYWRISAVEEWERAAAAKQKPDSKHEIAADKASSRK